jgi:transposase
MNTPTLDPRAAELLRGSILSTSRGRRLHRLHAVLLVARGLSCRQAAGRRGAAPRTVLYWVRRFERENVKGLSEKQHPGRPRRLRGPLGQAVEAALSAPPSAPDARRGRWTGGALSAHLLRAHGVSLSARQCQRLLRERRAGAKQHEQ